MAVPTPHRADANALGPLARFDDLVAGSSLQFSTSVDAIVAYEPNEVIPALAAVQAAVERGRWAFGMVAYEAAVGLLPGALVKPPVPGFPLVWFGISDGPDADPQPLPRSGYQVAAWQPEWDSIQHETNVARVREEIAAGNTYQCNLTTRFHSHAKGDLHAWYLDLADAQQGRHHAFLQADGWTVISASPECFFELAEGRIQSVPMKGTRRRHPSPEADDQARLDLLASGKDRAENIMIVDLIRNDLNRIAVPGTVSVTDLLTAEAYPTVWQLTSTVAAELRDDVELPEIFTALFPCGSITGTPKLATMALISELEDSPRGIYCGTVGYLSPDGRASFNVAIRTVSVAPDGTATYGAGGGITWDSNAAEEYDELLAKARILQPRFELIETFAVVDDHPRHLRLHLDRMEASASALGFHFDADVVAAALQTLSGSLVARLTLAADGTVTVTTRPLPQAPSDPVLLTIDSVRVDTSHGMSRHKTTQRAHFDAARARHPHADDVVLVGDHGRVTETTIASLMALLDGAWVTPPVSDGALPGVGRALAMAERGAVERPVTVADLRRAEALAVVSSVRGWREAVLLPE